jgi:hypothetical protein
MSGRGRPGDPPNHMNGPRSNESLLRPIQTTQPLGFSASARADGDYASSLSLKLNVPDDSPAAHYYVVAVCVEFRTQDLYVSDTTAPERA